MSILSNDLARWRAGPWYQGRLADQRQKKGSVPFFPPFSLDVEYLQRRTFWLDIKIILLTALKVIKRDNVTL
ncbi:MAG: sugar transferase [Rhodoferax sp.]|nr:sugar transferase [Rhodoferax sp.]MBE0474789.1 sugar transferase [Rhodoferax sp.]